MIAYIDGPLAAVLEEAVILEVGGLGLHVHVPANVLSDIPPVGRRLKLYTYLAVREDGMELFGFRGEADRTAFLQLLGVPGVGPRTALASISLLGAQRVWSAVFQEDAAQLATVPGIGKKISSRIILELKDRVKKMHLAEVGGASSTAAGDALGALIALGYNEREAAEALHRVGAKAPSDSGELVKMALKVLDRK